MKRIYFDYASTTPVDCDVIKAMDPYFWEKFGNPSSPHAVGRESQKALENARQTTAEFLGAKPEEIVFTSGGSESNNHAILGIARSLKDRGNHLILCAIEHHSVLGPALFLQKEGFKSTWVPVDRKGIVNPEDIKKAATDKTILIALIHASNEIGALQDVAAVRKIAREAGIYFHVDALQTVGHLPVNVDEIGCTTLSLAAHKFYGPKGAGALYIRSGTRINSYLLGGDQERGRRASTQNVAGAVGLAKAIDLCRERMGEEIKLQTSLRNKLMTEIPRRIDDCFLNGHPTQRLPNNAHFSFASLSGESLLMSLDTIGIAASMGSACTAGSLEPSHVLKAIGLSDELALAALRISIGRWTTVEEIDYFLDELPTIVERLRVVNI